MNGCQRIRNLRILLEDSIVHNAATYLEVIATSLDTAT